MKPATNFSQIGKYLLLTLLTAGFLFPVYVMVISSFKPNVDIFDLKLIPDWGSLTLDNYVEVFRQERFDRYILNSLFIAVAVTLLALLFHSMAAYALARLSFPGRQLLFGWILSTLMIPFSVTMIPLFIIVKYMGLVNDIWGIIIPSIPNAFGIFLLRQFYLNMPKDLEESAKIDGATHLQIYWKIFIPLSVAILVTLAVGFFLTNWNNYLWPLIVAQNRSLWTVQIAIANFHKERETLWNLVLAASCITVLPTVIIFSFLQKYLVEGIKLTGIKS